jgi:hypothetical protein
MVRPERRDFLADERSVRVSAGAPGSRPPVEERDFRTEAGRRKPVKEQGASKRAATLSERCSLVKLSAERCLRGPSRSCHGEGNIQRPARPDGKLGFFGVEGGGTLAQKIVEQERPSPAALSGKDGAYKAGRRKARGAGRESEGFIVCAEQRVVQEG